MRRQSVLLLILLGLFTPVFGQAPAATPPATPAATQANPPAPPIISPEVSADRSATFRLRAPNAKEVLLSREGATRQPMQKDEKGLWTLTVGPLEPDYYGYTFVVDGVTMIDPSNSVIKPNLLNLSNMFHVPGPSTLPWELNNVPHGEVHRHLYHSTVAADDRDYYVYTPPGYSPGASKQYPVLYLLHGFSDDARGWTDVGMANVILDNLIAQGKAKPMLVVMPLGYGTMKMVQRGSPAFRDPGLRKESFDKYRDNLLTEIIPEIEKTYRVSKDRNSRAIAGLSMGGAESLTYGLNALDRFAWIGAFSSGGLTDDLAGTWPGLDEKANAKIRLLWIACGVDDRLMESNRKTRDWLTSKGVKHTWIETPGAHVWMVWRRNLATFAPLLFTP